MSQRLIIANSIMVEQETVQQLLDFARSVLADSDAPFYLYTAPPKKVHSANDYCQHLTWIRFWMARLSL